MAQITQATPYVHLFWLALSPDGKLPALGKMPTVTISKAGAAFVLVSGPVFEVGNGWYAATLLPGDTAVLGNLAYHYESPGCVWCDGYKDQVILPPPVDVAHGDNATIIALLGQLVAGLCPTR